MCYTPPNNAMKLTGFDRQLIANPLGRAPNEVSLGSEMEAESDDGIRALQGWGGWPCLVSWMRVS